MTGLGTWALIQIAYVIGGCALVVLTRVLLDALHLFHKTGMTRIHDSKGSR